MYMYTKHFSQHAYTNTLTSFLFFCFLFFHYYRLDQNENNHLYRFQWDPFVSVIYFKKMHSVCVPMCLIILLRVLDNYYCFLYILKLNIGLLFVL